MMLHLSQKENRVSKKQLGTIYDLARAQHTGRLLLAVVGAGRALQVAHRPIQGGAVVVLVAVVRVGHETDVCAFAWHYAEAIIVGIHNFGLVWVGRVGGVGMARVSLTTDEIRKDLTVVAAMQRGINDDCIV